MAGQIRIANMHEGFEGRPCREIVNMSIAQVISLRATCKRGQVGCVIVRDNRIISTAYNGPIGGAKHCNENNCNLKQKCEHSIHAEINAISFAANHGIPLRDSTLYCTTMPCLNCAKVIIQAGIVSVYYMSEYTDTKGVDLLVSMGIRTSKISNV